MKYAKKNENLIVIGATRTGKTLLLKNLQSDIPERNKVILDEKNIESALSFFNTLKDVAERSLKFKENISIFIDSQYSQEILLNDDLFDHIHRFISEKLGDLSFYIFLDRNPSLPNLGSLFEIVNNRIFTFNDSELSQRHFKIGEIDTSDFLAVSFEAILKEHLEIFGNK